MTSALVSLKSQTRLVLIVTVLVIGGTGAWSSLQTLSGAIVAIGSVMVEANVKKIQHPTGGVVKALLAREGMEVQAGDLLIQLDDTALRAALSIIVNDLISNQARLARLEAERRQQPEINFRDNLVEEAKINQTVRLVLESERHILLSRHSEREGQKAQLRERISQMKQQADGLLAQKQSLNDQRQLAAADDARLQNLAAQGLVPAIRTGEIKRELVRLDGSLGSVVAQIAEAADKQAEIELQILSLDKEAASEISKEIRETEAKIEELLEKKIAAEDQLKRTDLRAPEGGIIHHLGIHTIGGVVGPGEVLMTIVPKADPLFIEAKVRPVDIDQIHLGQATRLAFSAFNQRTTPNLTGHVFRIAADLTIEERTGFSYYTVGIRIPASELQKLGSLQLVSGMPVEAFIQTGERTVASYLFKPFTDQMNRAMREE